MKTNVNLDALIKREDFEYDDNQNVTQNITSISINNLRKGDLTFELLRKPDFQRETNEWDSEKIYDLILSFLEGDLIPSVILWRSKSNRVFIIDGSHRLSAIAAWINDDYGDGKISSEFFDNEIPEEQKRIAENTRKIINSRIGSFIQCEKIARNPDLSSNENIIKYSRALGVSAFSIQWVTGNSQKAEESFFRINQKATKIDKTEIKVLKARKFPNGISARAIVRSGKGHKYWYGFSEDRKIRIEGLAKEVYQLLFSPELKTPLKTLDIPLGGKEYSSTNLPIVFDIVNIINNEDNKPDIIGDLTIDHLNKCKQLLDRINSNSPGSLGLHPIVYVYSINGRHKPTSLYALIEFIKYLEKTNKFNQFIKIREKFENLLLQNDYLIQQIGRRKRSGIFAYKDINRFYIRCIDLLSSGKSIEETVESVIHDSFFNYLTQSDNVNIEDTFDFSREQKSEIFVKEAISKGVRCKICNCLIHSKSFTIDHITRKADGGSARIDNGQLAHPYCNSTYKN
ncbi:MAG: hypothetical protein C0410_01975 [Anaerolinea sp.]|nr:hypothetical protein [Anaerolinea sp.]